MIRNNKPVIEILHHDEDGLIFQIQSRSNDKEFHTVAYDVVWGWICTCENYYYRKAYCKHMKACREYAESHGIEICDDNVYNEKPIVGGSV